MTRINCVRVVSVDGARLTLHLDHVYGWHWDRHLVSSRTLALNLLWEPLAPYIDANKHWPDGTAVTRERAQDFAASTPLGKKLLGRPFPLAETWTRANAGRIISCVGMVDREHHDDMWNDPYDERWEDEDVDTKECPSATFLIAVTDPRWIAHFTPGMEWDSTAYDHDKKITFRRAWRTWEVMLLAERINESHDFSAMPVLADALQEAGCNSDKLLNHFRAPNATHVRGCWALDLVLGKQ